MAFDLDNYVDVATRVAEFRDKHPDGSLQPYNAEEPFRVVTIGDLTFIAYTAAAYRSPEDCVPGIACAWEPFPGRTPYTKGSELMNAETSAWGRAIIAALAADSRKGVASAEEVRNRAAERDGEAPPSGPASSPPSPGTNDDAATSPSLAAPDEFDSLLFAAEERGSKGALRTYLKLADGATRLDARAAWEKLDAKGREAANWVVWGDAE